MYICIAHQTGPITGRASARKLKAEANPCRSQLPKSSGPPA